MLHKLLGPRMLAALLLIASNAHAINTEEVLAPDAEDRRLAVRIWYPNQPDHADAVLGMHLPLIVISHGAGGSNDNHVDTAEALAQAGFVVAAVTHTGDNYRDLSYVRQRKQLVERPRQLARTIDYLLTTWHAHQQLDASRIGMFGFSAGAFAALIMAGGVPDLRLVTQHCEASPNAWDCQYLRRNNVPMQPAAAELTTKWIQDTRIKAAVIAAPALGYTFEPQGLATVHIPIQLWDGGLDHIVDNSADIVRRLLPAAPDFHREDKAAHYSFLTPCSPTLREIIHTLIPLGTEPICDDPSGFDREQFHRTFNSEVVKFFTAQLH